MIQASGIEEQDPRITHTMERVKKLEVTKKGDELLTEDEFTDIVKPDLRMMCALTHLPSLDKLHRNCVIISRSCHQHAQTFSAPSHESKRPHNVARMALQWLQSLHVTHFVHSSGFTNICRLKILNHQLAIPDFHGFTNDLTALYHLVEGDTSGANADYIPILRCAADVEVSALH